ncbi:LysR family transcriptional regulator [Providencia rustigianii]|uniref:LysR family transcriptional regulator n=1 Tax=Providencia rustigianii TaxID=158850 RepID=UPI0022449063|nr:LysR family transcriptional regulator [Providencia rustigianii]
MANKSSLIMDNLFDLKVFVDVVETRSFTKSSENLEISRSAVGKCIARLETRLQARLLNRTTRRISLSDEGHTVYESALRILLEVENVENILSQGQLEPRGLLRITAPIVFGRKYILPLIQIYLQRWPETQVDMELSDDYCDIVGEGFDIAIRIGGNDDNRLIRKVLAPHSLITCASPEYIKNYGIPTKINELENHQTLSFRHRGHTVPWQFKTEQGHQNYSAKGRLLLNDTEAILDMALQGHGICQLGAFLVGPLISSGQLVPVLSDYTKPENPIYALYPTRRYLPPKVRQFLQLFDEHWKGKAIWHSSHN